MTPTSEILLCCLLWARDGEAEALTEYEDGVLALIPRHGGEVIQRAVGDGADGRPHEVQLYRFPDHSALDAYVADPDRVALTGVRDRVVARTELFPVALR
ncbi:hypothetical protein [Leifsonia sp. NPDC080035]|uniref:DUF1330 domain-containing protein n=1 Tax=Leifsonia sp. NPDC080035 TaxID=3143936 RepID=A0AAU7GGE6_9MICO